MSLFNLSRSAEDVSFSAFTVQDPTTDLLLGKLLGLVSYFDNVDYSEASKLEDLFYWALQGKEVYRVWYGGFKYYAQRVSADQFNIVVREPNRREVTIRTNDYEMLLNPFYGANPQRFGVMFGMASNGIGRRLDSQAQIKIYWKTKVSSGLKEVWDRIRERLTQQQQLAREFNGVSVIGSDDDIKQIQPDYSGSLQNDANLAIEIALSEYGMPRELLYGQSNEVTIIAFAIQKVLPLLKQHDKNIIFNQENFVAYIFVIWTK
ncbi:capsid and scaffold protein [Lactococcus phage CHPC1161]|uniref:Capsid and scaffold protein n=1 Tax=Lactococcus phage CHPC1161 TaxID=2675239 RepID=A0A650ERE7_9CAUD|nr:capsid and scaffold protein [Lactococcus phage CHPC1161]